MEHQKFTSPIAKNSLKAILLLFVLVLSGRVHAQTVSSYVFSAFNNPYTAVAGSPLPAIQQDNGDITVPIGFNFNFADGVYASATISANGCLAFSPGPHLDTANTLAAATNIGPMLMPLWENLSGLGGTATYTTTGTAPNRVFAIEYSDWAWSYSALSGAISMQLRLYETDNIIEFQYNQGAVPLDSFAGGATIGIFNNATDWQTLSDAITNPISSTSVFTSNILQKPASDQVYRWAPAPTLVGTNFSVNVYSSCTGPHLVINTPTYIGGMGVKVYFGDSQTDSAAIVSGNMGGHAVFDHGYPVSGTYTIKMKLYNGNALIDSLTLSYQHQLCNTVYTSFYYDDNLNCVQDVAEMGIMQPSLIEVDSNGSPVDTISATTAFYYTAYGNVGDIYQYKPISMPPGYIVSCPVSGIITDTLKLTNNGPSQAFAYTCAGGNDFDLGLSATTITGRHTGRATILLNNAYCAPHNATLSMVYNPGYSYNHGNLQPTTALGNLLTWDINNISVNTLPSTLVSASVETPVQQWLTVGTPVQYIISVSPTAGDMDTSDNTVIIDDTVTGSFDPNYIQVSPEGYIPTGTKLKYTIEFENTGNDTALNIYVLDTLPNELDLSSMRIISASAYMNVVKYNDGVHNIIKFDFPNINLPDSVHHPDNCMGIFEYTINTKAGLPDGTMIDNRAGIYFDDNEVVMTNTAENIIGIPAQVNSVGKKSALAIYPNPASDELLIRTNETVYTSFSISNGIGQVILQQDIKGLQTKVNVKDLPAGMYYINLVGPKGNEVRKFMKM